MSDPTESWMCGVCGFEYQESEGWADSDIPPHTRWVDVPDDWRCPQCGAEKDKFEPNESE
ncbi:rubredoxin [Sphingobium sp. V4]|uniref:rubredoxin n=1 Tax=Sphingobium sp. V4 TaxID=3038927 RepID=UPI003334A8BF